MNAERHNNFDSLRLLAALGVMVTHSFALLGLPEQDLLYFATHGALSFSRLGLYTFFALSGYLVCGSLLRSTSLFGFFAKRMLRIFPGLLVVLLLSVFALGPVATALPLGAYFGSIETWSYLLGATLYRVHDVLPGVFTQNPYPSAVNGSLWTLAYEFTLYLVLAFGLWAVKGRARVVQIGLAGAVFLLTFTLATASAETLQMLLPGLLLRLGHLVNFALLFLVGALLWTLPPAWVRDYRVHLGAGGLLALSIAAGIVPALVIPLVLPVLLLGLGYAPLPRLARLSASGDYSYGFYIYAFPVQQVLAGLVPATTNPYLFALLAIAVTAPFALLSWHWIEKPALALKSRIGT